MSVLHETEQRPLLGRGRQQAEHGESDQEPVRDVTRCEAQGDVQRVLLGLRERVELVEHRRTELMDPGERELHLRLHARDLRHTESRGLPSDVPEQRRLSDARLASDDEDGALTLAPLCQEPVEHFALAGPVEKPGRNGGHHLAGNANRRGTRRKHARVESGTIPSGLLRMSSQARSEPSLEPPQRSTMRLLVTGGTGVLGRALRPLAEAAGHEFAMPGREELDLFDPSAVADAVRDVDGVLHLATRIRSLEQVSDPDAWRENDRLRADASRILVDAAIAAGAAVYVQPTVTFVYPPERPGVRGHAGPRGPADPALRARRRAADRALRPRRRTRRRPAIRAARRPGHLVRPADGRLRRHAAHQRCRARAPPGAVAAQRHLQRLP